mmetsp:Transcript_626/g.1289  ORF Transcript_626/g.1289 Transcript_626/m.1289 type:complete len:356 (+) Transcript_626:74-1141(+)
MTVVWVKIRGGASKADIEIDTGQSVADLRRQVKKDLQEKLRHASLDDILIFPSKAAFEEHPEQAEWVEVRTQLRKMGKTLHQIGKMLPSMADEVYRLRPISSKPTEFDQAFHDKVVKFYGTESCLILAQLYTKTHEWYLSQGENLYPGVAEHIFHKDQWTTADALGIPCDHERNGLMLAKHLEVLFQDMHISLVPVDDAAIDFDKVKLKVYIPKHLHTKYVRRVDSKGQLKKDEAQLQMEDIMWKEEDLVQDVFGNLVYNRYPIMLGDLHLKEITIKRPFMRSLFMHGCMAYKRYKTEFVDPKPLMQSYGEHCTYGMRILRENMGIPLGTDEGAVEEDVTDDNDGSELGSIESGA